MSASDILTFDYRPFRDLNYTILILKEQEHQEKYLALVQVHFTLTVFWTQVTIGI